MQIRKIRFKRTGPNGRIIGVLIKYSATTHAGDEDMITMDCTDAPAPEFIHGMGAIAEHVFPWIGFAGELFASGLDLSHHAQTGALRAVITLETFVERAGAAMSLRLPRLTEHSGVRTDDEGREHQVPIPVKHFGPDLKATLLKIVGHAEDYVRGVRAQMDLFTVEQKAALK